MGQDNHLPTKANAGDHKGQLACFVTPTGTTVTEEDARAQEKKLIAEMKDTPEYKTATPHQKQNFARFEAQVLSTPCDEMQAHINEAASKRKSGPGKAPTEIQAKVTKAVSEIEGPGKAPRATTGFHP